MLLYFLAHLLFLASVNCCVSNFVPCFVRLLLCSLTNCLFPGLCDNFVSISYNWRCGSTENCSFPRWLGDVDRTTFYKKVWLTIITLDSNSDFSLQCTCRLLPYLSLSDSVLTVAMLPEFAIIDVPFKYDVRSIIYFLLIHTRCLIWQRTADHLEAGDYKKV